MKKFFSVLLAVALVALSSAPVFAHGGHHGGRARGCLVTSEPSPVAPSYEVCPYADCTESGWHLHDDTLCRPHYYGDGHEYHEQFHDFGAYRAEGGALEGYGLYGDCPVVGCIRADIHGHSGWHSGFRGGLYRLCHSYITPY